MKIDYSILFWVNKSRINKISGECPVYVRITINSKRAEISTGKSVPLDKWNAETGRVKGNNEQARTVNRYLDQTSLAITRVIERLEDDDELITPAKVKEIYTGKNKKKHSLLDLFAQHNERIESLIGHDYSAGTLERYQTTLKHTKEFIKKVYGKSDFFVEDLKYQFIVEFEYYLKAEKGIGHNTVMKYLRNFKKIVLIAVNNEWILRDPFMRFKITLREVKKEFLNKKELAKIVSKDISIDRTSIVRDIFVFCCYTGLAYADVARLKISNVSIGADGEYWVFINRKKTGVDSYVPLLPEAKRIIEKYRPGWEEMDGPEKLFPVISNQKMNSYLKEIADICEIRKNITFHMARHTFATTVTLSNGVSMESVSSMLGHKNIRTTQIYAKVVKEKVSREMKMLRNNLNN